AQDLAIIKASLNQHPWKEGYAILAADSHSQLTYTMQGPFATVTRNPDLNRGQWDGDMIAVWNLARMWYFTGNTAYAQKAHDILIAWATTQTSFGGQEAGLELGDYAFRYAGGADILRATWSGWTSADTTTVQNYFLNVFWPACSASGNVPGEANKGLLNMEAGMAIAAFCDDTTKFNHVIDLYRTYPGAGQVNSLPTGEMGETGRDAGHLYGGLLGAAFISEVAWKQGIDLYSDFDNRLLACGEYYARNTLFLDNPFVPFGTVDYTYYANAAGPYTADRAALYIIQNAYKNRFGLPAPWIDLKLQSQPVNADNWMYAKTADYSTATPPSAVVRPDVSPASSGLTLTTLGSNSTGRSVSYASGVWTLKGLGNGVWQSAGRSDDCQFAYQAMTGDCALVAQVTSFTNSGTQAGKCGLMIRDNLSATISQRGLVDVTWNSSGTNSMECRQDGWTENWGGSGWASRSDVSPLGLPYWLKIERRGNLVTGYTSQDGTSWAPIVSSYYGNLPSTIYIGLFICSGNTTVVTGTFAHLAFTGGTGGLVTAPTAPAAVFASGSANAITVRWLPSFGATSYNLLRSTTSGSGYAAIASNLSTATTSYVDTTAAAGTTYYYVVQAANSAGTSGNSPQFYGSLLSAPMVNLAFGGITTASINAGPQVGGSDTAFDGDPGSKWYCYNSPTGWIQYDFGAGNAQAVKRYTVNSADVPARDPIAWSLLGSQDGSAWTTLDTQSGQSFAIPMAQNTYNISNTTAYRYYRLNITSNNGATGVAISELGLWGDAGRTMPDGTYYVVNRYGNKPMAALNGGTAGGTQLVQWTYSGGGEQKWTFSYLGSGEYKITGLASGRVVNVSGNSNSNGANLILWDWNGATNEQWSITPIGDGYFRLTALNSGKVADVAGPSTADGAVVHQWDYVGVTNQKWSFTIMP
ncbi:MAG TPA: RICIN domain-containing protein, partial [Chthoniobacterales bacterium]